MISRSAARWIAYATVAGAAVACGVTEILGLDMWWHLAIGRAAVETWSTLPTNVFSFSRFGAPWPYKDLTAAVLLFLGYSAGGLFFFAWYKGAFVVALAGALLGGRRVDPVVALSIFGLLVCGIAYDIVERPLLFSLALLPYVILTLERLREVSRASVLDMARVQALLVRLLLLMYAGTLLHRGALVAYGLLIAYACESIAAWLAPPALASRLLGGKVSREAALATVATALASPLLALATPSGFAFFTTGLRVPAMAMLRERITEWHQLPPAELVRAFPMVAALAFGALLVWAWQLRRAGPAKPTLLHGALVVLFCALAANSVRWVPSLAIVAAVLLLIAAEHAVGERLAWPERTRVLSCLLVATLFLTTLVLGQPLAHRLGLRPEFEPTGAMAFAREHRLGERMGNAFNLGGYPLWAGFPEQRVLVDGRNEQVYSAEFLLRVFESEREPRLFSALQAEQRFDWVIACNRPGQLSHAYLSRDPRWWLVYFSEAAVIYVRADRYPQLAGLRFRLLEPIAPDVAVERAFDGAPVGSPRWRTLEGELSRARAASPLGLRVLASSALFYHRSGPEFRAQRDQLLGTLLREHAGHPVLLELARRFESDR